MGDTLLTAIALMLVIEGILPFAAPERWREVFRRLTALKNGQVRYIGLLSMGAGVVLFLFVTVWKH